MHIVELILKTFARLLASRAGKVAATGGALALIAIPSIPGIGGEQRNRFPLATATPTATPEPGTANLWVDTDGGTCTDNADPAEYSSAAACSSLDAANDTCENGDTVRVKAGSYGSQNVTGWNSRTLGAGDCTISEASGETVVLQELKTGTASGSDGPRALTYEGFRVVAASGQEDSVQVWGQADGITLRDIDAGNWYIETARNVLVDGGDWGPCNVPHAGGGAPGGDCLNNKIAGQTFTDNITIQDGLYHDTRCDKSGGNWDCHLECIKHDGGTDVVIKRNTFRDCAFYNIFVANETGKSFAGLIIENNQFDATWNEAYPTPAQTRATGVEFAPKSGTLSDMLVRFNSFESGTGISLDQTGTYTNTRVTGNLIGVVPADCTISGVTFLENVYDGSATCSGTGETALSNTFPYVNTGKGSAGDYRLTGATTGIDNSIATNVTDGCPSTDIDGDTRPAGTDCDAGMDER